MRLVNEHDLAVEAAKLEAKVKLEAERSEKAAKAFLATLLIPLDAWLGMLIVGGLHAQPDLHSVPSIGYFAALGIRTLLHIVTPSK